MHKTQMIGMVACTLAAAGQAAHATVINFDTFPNSAPVPDTTVILAQYAALGVAFPSPAAAGGPPAAVLVGEASSAPNGLYGLQGGAGLAPITIDFASPLSSSVSMVLLSVGDATVTATAYASDLSTVIDSVSLTHGPSAGNGFGNQDPITLNGPGITRVFVRITATGPVQDGFGIDDLGFDPVPAPGVALPLGASWLALVRRRR